MPTAHKINNTYYSMYLQSQTSTMCTIKSRDVPIIESAIILAADMPFLLYQQLVQLTQKTDITTDYSACENNL